MMVEFSHQHLKTEKETDTTSQAQKRKRVQKVSAERAKAVQNYSVSEELLREVQDKDTTACEWCNSEKNDLPESVDIQENSEEPEPENYWDEPDFLEKSVSPLLESITVSLIL